LNAKLQRDLMVATPAETDRLIAEKQANAEEIRRLSESIMPAVMSTVNFRRFVVNTLLDALLALRRRTMWWTNCGPPRRPDAATGQLDQVRQRGQVHRGDSCRRGCR
jgi:hypothetical protein